MSNHSSRKQSASTGRAFGPAEAAHLARRAGFGARPEEWAELVQLGPEQAVARFVDVPDEDSALEAEIHDEGGALADTEIAPGNSHPEAVEALRGRFLYRMVRSQHPLREKVTLFWHDHFACQERKLLRAPLVRMQLETLRGAGLGRFRDLLGLIARDPGMLVFLDGRLNHRDAVNENFARELLELFCLGVDRYEQRDVRELARVFTGWMTPDRDEPIFVYDPGRHDTGDKIVFGQRIRGRDGAAGQEEGEEALDLILKQPACAEFLADKLVHFFAHPEGDATLTAAVASNLRDNDYDLREALRVLFSHPRFQDPELRFACIKSPVEWAVSAARGLNVQNVHLANLPGYLRSMGMELFEPPSVAGWEEGLRWVDSGAVAARLGAALQLSELPHANRPISGRAAYDVDALVGPEELPTQALALRFLGPDPDVAVVDTLNGLLRKHRELPHPRQNQRRRDEVRFLAHALLSSPHFGRA